MREKISRKIQEKPGIHFRKLQREVECSSTTLKYHIEDLEVKNRRLNGYKRFFPCQTPEKLEKPLAALNHQTRGPMIHLISHGNDLNKELADRLKISKSTVSSHLEILVQDGIVEEKKKGQIKELSLTGKTRKCLERHGAKILGT